MHNQVHWMVTQAELHKYIIIVSKAFALKIPQHFLEYIHWWFSSGELIWIQLYKKLMNKQA